MNDILKFLTPNEILRNNLDQFKEAFIEFYGEESRNEVEEKFSKMLPIAYISPDQLKILLINLEKRFTDEIIGEILLNKDISISKKDLIGDYSFEFANLQPISLYQKFYEVYSLTLEKRQERFYDIGYESISRYVKKLSKEEYIEIIEKQQLPEKYENLPGYVKDLFKYYLNQRSYLMEYRRLYKDAEPLLKKIIPEIEFSNLNEFKYDKRLQELNKILIEYKSALEMYASFKNSLKDYYAKRDLLSDSKYQLQEKYHKIFISKFKHLIPAEKRKNLDEYLCGEKEDYELDSYVKYLLGNSLFSECPLEFFTSASKEKLTIEKDNWRKDEIIKQRIKYFKENGLNLGDEYKTYLESKQAQEIWPSPTEADNFVIIRNNCLNDFNIEFYTSYPDYQKIRKEIESLELLDKNDSFDASIYNKSKTFVAPNIRKRNNIVELFSLLVISLDNYDDDFKDHYIVHELNHLYELYLDLVGENEYSIYCGWDTFVEPIKDTPDAVDTLNENSEKRPYELFNEIINELIAQEISKIMHKNNIHVFDNPKTAKYKNSSSYEHSLFLVEDFFNEFRDKIIESRKNGNLQIIRNEVGKDNFDELNSLFEIYYTNFSGFKIYSLLADLKDNKDTEQTRIYHDLVDRKNIIMEKMHKFKEKQNESSYERKEIL